MSMVWSIVVQGQGPFHPFWNYWRGGNEETHLNGESLEEKLRGSSATQVDDVQGTWPG